MHLHFALLQFLDQCVDPFDAQAIEAVGYKLPVTMDSRLDLFALVAHGTPHWIRRERAALSVIDRRQRQGDDDDNNIGYVRFPTVLIFYSVGSL